MNSNYKWADKKLEEKDCKNNNNETELQQIWSKRQKTFDKDIYLPINNELNMNKTRNHHYLYKQQGSNNVCSINELIDWLINWLID